MQQHDDLLLVSRGRVPNDQRCRQQSLLLQRVGVHPMRTGLPDRESVAASFAGLQLRREHVRHAVLIDRRPEPVPMDDARLSEFVAQRHVKRLALAEREARAALPI